MTDGTGDMDLHAAAQEIGVHYQTAYGWVRNGRLRARKVSGRYVIERSELDSFAARRAAPVASPPTPRRLDGASTTMLHALVNGDEADARALARSLVDQGTPVVDLIQQIIVPPLRQIGQDWHEGHLAIWVEHRASAIVERILGDVVTNPRGRRRGTAMVAAVSGDRHSLATTMAAAALREDHWNVHHLGADMPPAQLIEFSDAHDLDLAVLTSTNPDTSAVAYATAEQLRTNGTATIVGGPGRSLEQLLREAIEAASGT